MIVKVTQEHIDKGAENFENGDPNNLGYLCPVALALKDVFKTKHTKVTYSILEIGLFPKDNIIFSRVIPQEVLDWITRFDLKCDVKPFEFELSLEGVEL